MPEHVHLLVHPRQPDHEIAQVRKAIKSPVAKKAIGHIERHAPNWLPRITRQRGNRIERLFWQSGGGYDRNVIRGETLLAVIDYIHLNPVRRGLAATPTDWKWSSAAAFLDGTCGQLVVDPIPAEWLSDARCE
jgi:REP-associated tyrosine transposase